jgi:hypothetical protein
MGLIARLSLGVLAIVVLAVIAKSAPDLARYVKIRQM